MVGSGCLPPHHRLMGQPLDGGLDSFADMPSPLRRASLQEGRHCLQIIEAGRVKRTFTVRTSPILPALPRRSQNRPGRRPPSIRRWRPVHPPSGRPVPRHRPSDEAARGRSRPVPRGERTDAGDGLFEKVGHGRYHAPDSRRPERVFEARAEVPRTRQETSPIRPHTAFLFHNVHYANRGWRLHGGGRASGSAPRPACEGRDTAHAPERPGSRVAKKQGRPVAQRGPPPRRMAISCPSCRSAPDGARLSFGIGVIPSCAVRESGRAADGSPASRRSARARRPARPGCRGPRRCGGAPAPCSRA